MHIATWRETSVTAVSLKVKNRDHFRMLSAKLCPLDGLYYLRFGLTGAIDRPSLTSVLHPFVQFASRTPLIRPQPLNNPNIRGMDFCYGRGAWQGLNESPLSIRKFGVVQWISSMAAVTHNLDMKRRPRQAKRSG
jgi:hypothetical protein